MKERNSDGMKEKKNVRKNRNKEFKDRKEKCKRK